MASNLNNMATIKELKEYLSQFPDDMETDIDSNKLVERHFLQSGKMVQSGVASKSKYNKKLEKYNKKI